MRHWQQERRARTRIADFLRQVLPPERDYSDEERIRVLRAIATWQHAAGVGTDTFPAPSDWPRVAVIALRQSKPRIRRPQTA